MGKILITGANGYIGARLSKLLSNNGYKVTALCYPVKPADLEWVNLMDKVIVADLRDKTTIQKLAKGQYDAIIHLVSLDHHQSEDSPETVSAVNVMPTWNLLETFTKENSLKKFIYFSTIHVYGSIDAGRITEKQIPNPKNKYALTHLLSENICNYYNSTTNVDCINVRLSNSYGSPLFDENNCCWLVINDLCKTAFLNKKIVLKSDGTPQRDFIHGDDVCEAIDTLLKIPNNKIKENTYHLSSGNTYTIMELACKVKEVYENRYGRLINICFNDGSVPDNKSTDNPDKYIIDNTKLSNTGFVLSVDISSGINEIFDYLDKREK